MKKMKAFSDVEEKAVEGALYMVTVVLVMNQTLKPFIYMDGAAAMVPQMDFLKGRR